MIDIMKQGLGLRTPQQERFGNSQELKSFGGRYRTRTAAEATAACGGNREPRLGQRSDFSKPCQGAAEKSANATRTGASRQIPSRFPTRRNVYRDDCRFVVGGTGREPERAKAGYHHDGGILPFALICFISRSQHPL